MPAAIVFSPAGSGAATGFARAGMFAMYPSGFLANLPLQPFQQKAMVLPSNVVVMVDFTAFPALTGQVVLIACAQAVVLRAITATAASPNVNFFIPLSSFQP